MSKTSIAGVEAAFKILYPNGTMPDSINTNTKLHKELTKTENFRGRRLDCTIKTANSHGIGKTVAAAQAADNDVTYNRYNLERDKFFAVARIDGEAAEAGEEDGSLVDIVEDKVSGVAAGVVADLAVYEYGNGSATRGAISTISTVTITMATGTNMNYFEVGMLVEVVDDNSTSTSVKSAAPRRILGIDRGNRVLTIDAAFGGTAAAGDYIVRSSMESTSARSIFHGLTSWLANEGASTASIYGMTRTGDADRLAGKKQDYTGQDPNEAVLDMCSQLANSASGDPNVLVVNAITAGKMKRSPMSRVFWTGGPAEVEYGFDKLAFRTETGAVRMLVDPFCPHNAGFLLSKKEWRLHSLRKAPHMEKFGTEYMVVQDDDAVEARWKFYGAMPCRNPAPNAYLVNLAA